MQDNQMNPHIDGIWDQDDEITNGLFPFSQMEHRGSYTSPLMQPWPTPNMHNLFNLSPMPLAMQTSHSTATTTDDFGSFHLDDHANSGFEAFPNMNRSLNSSTWSMHDSYDHSNSNDTYNSYNNTNSNSNSNNSLHTSFDINTYPPPVSCVPDEPSLFAAVPYASRMPCVPPSSMSMSMSLPSPYSPHCTECVAQQYAMCPQQQQQQLQPLVPHSITAAESTTSTMPALALEAQAQQVSDHHGSDHDLNSSAVTAAIPSTGAGSMSRGVVVNKKKRGRPKASSDSKTHQKRKKRKIQSSSSSENKTSMQQEATAEEAGDEEEQQDAEKEYAHDADQDDEAKRRIKNPGSQRKATAIACVSCWQAHTRCGVRRPCARCVRLKREAQCVDRPAVTRKRQNIKTKRANSD